MARFLTFDLGTTLYKVALFDDSGNLLAVERAVPPIQRPRPGWAVVDPDAFLTTLADAAAKLRERTGGDWSDVAAVSFATQANTFTFLDDSGDATHPFILWSDQRAAALAGELAELTARLPGFRETTGMPRLMPTLALAKVLWLRREHPESFDRARRLCFLSDFLTAYLTGGEPIAEAGVAGLSGALDIRTLQWRSDILEALNVPPIKMPPARRAGTDLDPLCPPFAQEFGLPPQCRFVVGCLDQYAGAIGTGCVEAGQVCETTGTVLAAVRCARRIDPAAPPSVFHGPSFAPDRFFQMTFSSTSANLLEHYRSTLPDRPSFEALMGDAARVKDAAEIHPYEEGRPLIDCFRQVPPDQSRGEIVRGILHRVALALKEQVHALALDAPPAEIRAAGGGAKSDLWLQMKADLLGVPMVRLACPEPTSLGAAILAAHGVGMGSVEELTRRWVRPLVTFRPQAE